jgi:hypothetical protein
MSVCTQEDPHRVTDLGAAVSACCVHRALHILSRAEPALGGGSAAGVEREGLKVTLLQSFRPIVLTVMPRHCRAGHGLNWGSCSLPLSLLAFLPPHLTENDDMTVIANTYTVLLSARHSSEHFTYNFCKKKKKKKIWVPPLCISNTSL